MTLARGFDQDYSEHRKVFLGKRLVLVRAGYKRGFAVLHGAAPAMGNAGFTLVGEELNT